MTTWSAAVSQHGAPALAKPPADVLRALAALEESSGDEESGDEFYRSLHRAMEEEEAKRLSGFTGTGAQRGRSQNKQQQERKDGGGGGGAPEKRAAGVAPPDKWAGAPEKRASSTDSKPPSRQPSGCSAGTPEPRPQGSDGGEPGASGGEPGATPTVVRRATAAGPGAAGLRRTSSGGGPAQSESPRVSGGQPQKSGGSRPARTPR
jgi:hypothetical protein